MLVLRKTHASQLAHPETPPVWPPTGADMQGGKSALAYLPTGRQVCAH